MIPSRRGSSPKLSPPLKLLRSSSCNGCCGVQKSATSLTSAGQWLLLLLPISPLFFGHFGDGGGKIGFDPLGKRKGRNDYDSLEASSTPLRVI